MPIGTIAENIALAGISIQSSITRTASGQISHEVILSAADAGTLSTRTTDTAGTLTMDDAGHGISTGDIIDIYWTGGVAYGATVGTVSGTSVPFTLAGGDALPAQGTDVTADVQQEINTDFDGDDMKMLAVVSTKRGHIHFQEEDGTDIDAEELSSNEGWTWASDTGVTNPLAGNPVGQVMASNGDLTGTATLKIGVLYDSEV
ncbi:MAG: hypothetical protein U9N87_08865 [Planctomycetota bacterium]|nr:hypothetical protein [Planctomycetota bacterium]